MTPEKKESVIKALSGLSLTELQDVYSKVSNAYHVAPKKSLTQEEIEKALKHTFINKIKRCHEWMCDYVWEPIAHVWESFWERWDWELVGIILGLISYICFGIIAVDQLIKSLH